MRASAPVTGIELEDLGMGWGVEPRPDRCVVGSPGNCKSVVDAVIGIEWNSWR